MAFTTRLDLGPTSTPSVVRNFDIKSGAVRCEEHYDLLKTSGLAAGAQQERWLRTLVRTSTPGTNELRSEEVFRRTGSFGGQWHGSKCH
jgi:hypothetical protein